MVNLSADVQQKRFFLLTAVHQLKLPLSLSLCFRTAHLAGAPQHTHTFLVVVGAQLAKHGGYVRIELMADVAEQADRPNENNLFPPKKHLRSAVWEHFGYKKDVNVLLF